MSAFSLANRAWVGFTGKTDLAWLRFLRPGFRHCYVILHDGHRWQTFDPMAHVLEIQVHHHLPADFDLPAWLRGRGHKIVPAGMQRPHKQAPWMPFSCVEAVKRVIGVHSRRIWTPWQLYRHLARQSVHADLSAGLPQDFSLSNPDKNEGENAWPL